MYTRDRAPTPEEIKAHLEAHAADVNDGAPWLLVTEGQMVVWWLNGDLYYGIPAFEAAAGKVCQATPLDAEGRPVAWPTPPEGMQRVELLVGVTPDVEHYAASTDDEHGHGHVGDALDWGDYQLRRVTAWVRRYEVPVSEGVEVADAP